MTDHTVEVKGLTKAFKDTQVLKGVDIVDTLRSLLASEPVGSSIWIALAWCVGISGVAWFFAARAYRGIA